LTASPQNVPADGKVTTTLTATYRDANGNPVPGLQVTFASSGSANTFSSTSGTTDAFGTTSVTLKSPRAELKTVTATAAGLTLQTLVSFDPGPPSAARSSVAANPDTLEVANGVTIIVVTVRDALDNPIPGLGAVINVSGSDNYFDPPFSNSGVTGGAGTFQVGLHTYTAETKAITAIAGPLTLTNTVTFTPGPPSWSRSTLSATPSTVKADGIAYSTVTFTVRDSLGNVVPNYQVSLSTAEPTDTWSPSNIGNTNAGGVFSARLSSRVTGTRTVQANAGGTAVLTADVQFVP
jgi:adhesin/invasin